MTTVNVEKVTDLGNDRILVTGTVDGHNDPDGNPVIVQAPGWLSAMTNYYPADAYGEDGHLVDGATAREMTDDEKHAYWADLLSSAVPTEPAPTVLYESE